MAGSPVNPGSFEVKLPVDFHGGAKDISHDHPVCFSIVHCQSIHSQVLRQQGLPLSGNHMLGGKKAQKNMGEFLLHSGIFMEALNNNFSGKGHFLLSWKSFCRYFFGPNAPVVIRVSFPIKLVTGNRKLPFPFTYEVANVSVPCS